MGKALGSKGKKRNSKRVKFISGQQVVSAGCATQAWQPEFDPPNLYGGNKRTLTQDSSLTTVHRDTMSVLKHPMFTNLKKNLVTKFCIFKKIIQYSSILLSHFSSNYVMSNDISKTSKVELALINWHYIVLI